MMNTTSILYSQSALYSDSNSRKLPLQFHGNIGLGYDYGLIPFSQNLTVPTGYFKTDGNLSLQIKDLPFNATFFYTNLKNINGLNNFFRVSFDAQAYKQILNKKLQERKEKYIKKIPSLQHKYQQIQKKIAYLNHVEGNLEHYYNLPDSNVVSLDSINLNTNLEIPAMSFDSLDYQTKLQVYKDSILQKKQSLLLEGEHLLSEIDTYKSIQNGTNDLLPDGGLDTMKFANKTQKWFSHVQKLDIGMCYPSYSTFLVSNIPLKGINFEYENKGYFYAFSAGTTINNLLFTNNVIQNNLQNTQNLFNFFDFNSPQQGRKILSGKFGWGKMDGDHFFLGAMYGSGMQSYYYDSLSVSVNGNPIKEHNLVIELDGRIKPKKWLDVNIVYGKSSIRPLNDEMDSISSSVSQLFSSYRSNAVLGKVILSVPKIKSNITLSGRWVDPFFRSYGIGFMRADNFRYEIKTDHQLGKKLKAGLFYRKDENNLLNYFSYTTILHSGGVNLQYRITKNISVRGNFNPVFMESFDSSNEVIYSNENYIANLSASHHTRIKKTSVVTNFIYSYYKLFNGFTNTDFINISLNNTVSMKKITNTMSASVFKTQGIDSLSGNTFLIYENLTVNMKNINLTGGLKFSKHLQLGNQLGYSLKVNAKVNKNISLELRGEKLVLGDFYNSIGIDLYRTYPYLWSGRIIINW